MPIALLALVDDTHHFRLVRGGPGAPWGLPVVAEASTPEAAWAEAVAALSRAGAEVVAGPEPLGEAPGAAGVRVGVAVLAALPPAGTDTADLSLEAWEALERSGEPAFAGDVLRAARAVLERDALRLPYLGQGEHDYIYRFRTERERNRAVYGSDAESQALYQSRLCAALKALRRTRERLADAPTELDFGPVRYVLPSHFGFCLGVQNAIERAYETLAGNPGRRVFMLSELIHNPFVNEDLVRRGLLYLQSDKGVPIVNPVTGGLWWDELTPDDIVIIPAFGATDQDKLRLVRRGLPLNRHDATCMLVEKVWKAARRFGLEGWTVLLHGKAEHEETKATFSNSARHAPTLILRDVREAEALAAVLRATDPGERRRLFAPFASLATPGFDPAVHLDRVAVVNQTTLLRNETLRIIDLLGATYAALHGADAVDRHLNPRSRGDTLCYATQVNQDALGRALELPVDAALVLGGRNSSNTYQLYRLCAERHGERAHYVQSERDVHGPGRVDHYRWGSVGPGEPRPLFDPAKPGPVRILVTGGASCPDGIVQQVIARINGFFPASSLRDVEAVIAGLDGKAAERG